MVKLDWQWKTYIPNRVSNIENPVSVRAAVTSKPTLNYEEQQFFKNYYNGQLRMEFPDFSIASVFRKNSPLYSTLSETNSDYVCLPHTFKIHIILIFSHLSLGLARGFRFSRLSFSMISLHFISMCPAIFTIIDYYYHYKNITQRAKIMKLLITYVLIPAF